jgi:HEAT repeats/Putative zinc-finger
MNCESVVKLIPLYYYGELPPEEEERVEQHLDGCAACGREAERQRAVAAALDRRQLQPPPALLAECRQDLMRAVYRGAGPAPAAAHSTPWSHFREGFFALFPGLERWRTPIGAMALVALGFFSARFVTPGAGGPLSSAALAPENMISSVRSVQAAPPGSPAGEVRIVVDQTQRRVLSGPLSDENIQRLLLAAAHDETNPGVRVESVDILKNHSDSREIRSLLLNRLLHDPNPGVRLKALDGLKAFTSDPEVRQGLAQALLQDDNPGVRISAVDALTAHASDDVVGMLQRIVEKEDNSYVRRRCEKALKDQNASVGTF